ncbi:phosphodiester glycosidase family protein [Actinomadura sp. GC306]|nr:phosphodiester glycosidase family protein [Actinomadura sp. GC306]
MVVAVGAGGAGPVRADGQRWPGVDGAGSGERPDAREFALAPSRAVGPLRFTSSERLAPGVVARTFATTGVGGPVRGDLLDVDLRAPGVRVGLLAPPKVAARRTVSAMADARGALAGVNGDFFNITEARPGVVATGSSSGPAVDAGRPLKGAVPDGQRFGPALPPGTSSEAVIGIGADGRGRLGRLRLAGTIRSKRVTLPLRGLNQYALPVDGAGAFTHDWGSVSRRRAVCGTDTARNAPCSTNTVEVTVRRGVVAKVGGEVGAGPIPLGTTVLVGREEAADALRRLRPGDRVAVTHRLTGPVRFRFAVGGVPVLRDGEPLKGLDPRGPAPRTAAGFGRGGHRMYLVVADGRSAESGGLTLAELADLLAKAGADDAVNLDGGGSSTFVARSLGEDAVTVRNTPSAGAQRAVANGIGVFHRP